MTWMNFGYMVLGVIIWQISKMLGQVAEDLGRHARHRRRNRHFIKSIEMKIAKARTDKRDVWLNDFINFWDEFGAAADKMWQPAPAYVMYDSPIKHVGRWF